jgi:hypothetical protein
MITPQECAKLATKVNTEHQEILVSGVKANGDMYLAKVVSVRWLVHKRWELLLDLRSETGFRIEIVDGVRYNSLSIANLTDKAKDKSKAGRPKKEKKPEEYTDEEIAGFQKLYEALVKGGKI